MMMQHENILSRLRTIFAALALVDESAVLAEDVGLLGHGIGLDSIELLRVVTEVEEEFGFTLADAELKPEYFETVGSLVQLIASRGT